MRLSDYDPKPISNGIIRFSLLWSSPSLPPQAPLVAGEQQMHKAQMKTQLLSSTREMSVASTAPWCLNLFLFQVNWKNREMSICCGMAMAPSLTGCELLVEGPPCSLSALPLCSSDHGWSCL